MTINDGLSQSSVNALLEDSLGYLWIGTQDGLNRFDGYDFIVMRHVADDGSSLFANNISSLYEDAERTVWIGTNNGALHRYVRDSETFERFRLPTAEGSSDESAYFEDVREILETRAGRFWIGTRSRGLFEFARDSAEFRQVSTIAEAKINRIVEGGSGELWIGTDEQGLLWFFPDEGVVERATYPGSEEQVFGITMTRADEIWVAGSSGNITRFDSARRLIGQFSARLPGGADNYAARAMIEDADGRIWIGFIGGGLQAFAADGRRLGTFLNSASDPFSPSTNTVYSLLQDRSGVLWVGSLAAGLSKASLAGGRFTHYRHRPEDPSSLSHNMVNEFAEDAEGGIWVGTSGGGVNRLDPADGTFVKYRAVPDDPRTLSSDRIWGMHLEKDTLWVGTWGGGLNRLDRATGIVDRCPAEGAGALPGIIVTAIVGDGADGVWVGMADGGVARVHPDGCGFDRHFLFDQDDEQERPVNVASLYRDSTKQLWVGTWTRGLCRLPADSERFHCYAYDPLDPGSINDNNIRAINEGVDGTIWIATGNGIARFEAATETFTRFTSAHGLVEGVIYGVVPEDETTLWLSSNQGLMRLDTVSGEIRKFDYKDGLQANEFNGGSYLMSSDSVIYFGGIAGVSSFTPNDLANNPVPPIVVISDLMLFNEPVAIQPGVTGAILQKALSATDSVTLEYDQNFLGFEFAGLHFVSPELNRYAYRLDDVDPDWVYTDATRRFATYTNLDPGEYRFSVRAANSDGVWSDTPATLGITILPPWWMTWWARLLMLAAGVLTVILFVQWRLSLLRIRTRELEAEVESRTHQILEQKQTIEEQAAHVEEVLDAKNRFFARLSHEFRTPITLMLGPIDEQLGESIGEKTRRGLTMARRNGRRLLHLVDQLLGLAKHSGDQKLERNAIPLVPVARMVVASFESAARAAGLSITLHTDDDVWVESNSDALQTIFVNLISNAIKYTEPGGTIEVSVMRDEDQAMLRVADTGIGIAAEERDNVFNIFERATTTAAGTGIGLTLVKELVDAHQGSISLDSEEGAGTTIEIRIDSVTPAGRGTADLPDLQATDVDHFLTETRSNADTDPGVDDVERARVLVIEDNDDMRAYIIGLLSSTYRCSEAADGRDGLDQARESVPDLIVSDVMMPELDGFEVLHALRDDELTCHIPLILLTALDDESNRLRGLAEFADDYIGKPFNRAELVLKIRNLLELNRLRARRAGETYRDTHRATDNLSARDRRFVDRLEATIAANYQDPELRLETIADAMFVSPRQLQRKLKALLDTVPATYVRDYRLQKAREMLIAGEAVTDVAFATGFSSPSYFGKCFKARYDLAPSEVRQG